ncbi:hypothetical protein V498_04484 [Pseudogymnoascus sp. VKM F-4517 (FW-2822)]|nr:hypothetical protein V498_04484 [Pseudogymnoascus sp. VKM F-4517 (FW-2822)]
MDPHVLPINTPQGKPEGDVKDTRSFSKGSKRLFSHTLSRHSQEEDGASNYGSCSDGRHLDEDDPVEKRYRTSDWPLGSNRKASEAYEAGSPTCNYSDDGVQPRSSKFIEGSMSNRVSQKPPRKYVVTETELSCAEENEGTKNEKPQRNKLIRNSNHSVPAVAGEAKTETNRHSTIFRFGKSLAASFNPSNWKIWSKAQDAQVPDDKADAEAQAKLERAYREVKNIAPTPGRRFGPAGNSGIWSSARSSANTNMMDLSSVDNSEQPSQKRYGMVFDTPPSTGGLGSDDYSVQQSPSKLSTPAELYPVPSHQLLHSNDSRSSFTYGTIAPPGSVKHVPSRKDLRVQQKLVKRVSNLESKLEAARLELVKSMGNAAMPQPVRGVKSRFVPGALSSLPSESLLNAYTHQNESTQSSIGAALTTDEKISLAAARTYDETPGRPSISSFASSSAGYNHDDTPGRPSFASSIREHQNYEATATAPPAPEPTDLPTPSKKRKNLTKPPSSTSSSRDPDGQDPTTTTAPTSHPRPNPAKKARNNNPKPNSAKDKPAPELLIPSTSSSSSPGSENLDPMKKAVAVPVGVKQLATPKLIVKKRAPLEAVGGGSSRIPRKGSRKGTPPSNEIRDGDEMPAAENQERVGGGAGKLKKVPKPRVKSSEAPAAQVDEGKKTTREKMTTSTSTDSFEWGPDVF